MSPVDLMKYVDIEIDLTEEEWNFVRQSANDAGMSVDKWVTKVIWEHLLP